MSQQPTTPWQSAPPTPPQAAPQDGQQAAPQDVPQYVEPVPPQQTYGEPTPPPVQHGASQSLPPAQGGAPPAQQNPQPQQITPQPQNNAMIAQPVQPVANAGGNAATNLIAVDASQGLQLPEYLANTSSERATAAVDEHINPPALKVIQKMAGEEWANFPVGTCVVTPGPVLVMHPKCYVPVVPVHLQVEYTAQNPYALRNSMPYIHERSFDSKSEIAFKAKNFVKDKFEFNGQVYERKYVVSRQIFFLFPTIAELQGIPVLVRFQRGDAKSGIAAFDLIRRRELAIRRTMFVHQFALVQATHQVQGQQPHEGLDLMCVQQPDCGPLCPESHLGIAEQMYHMMKGTNVVYEEEEEELQDLSGAGPTIDSHAVSGTQFS